MHAQGWFHFDLGERECRHDAHPEHQRWGISTTISQTLVDNLPINGHNFVELTQLVPAAPWPTATSGMARAKAAPTTPANVCRALHAANVNGNRTYTTNFTIDGISIVDTGATSPTATARRHTTLRRKRCRK